MKKEWSKISLIFLFIVALIGTFLRSANYIPIFLEYANLVHAHSHIAFQGWIYTIMILLLTNIYLDKEQIKAGNYSLQYKLTIVVTIGILISFALQGYGLYSIIFSTLFQFLNYWFIYRFIKDTRRLKSAHKNLVSLRLIKVGLIFGILSTLMPYGIGILAAKGLGGTEIYQSFVYTFLHLQYNGWFLFVVLGLFYKFLENNSIPYNQKYATWFYRLFTFAVLPAISLSLIGMSFSSYIKIIAYVTAVTLGAAFLFFIKSLPRNLFTLLQTKSKLFQLFLTVFLASFALKMILQCSSVLPLFESFAFYNKPIILAYLHLSLIGSISFLFLAWLFEMQWLSNTKLATTGGVLFVLGFVSTELSLIFSGLAWYNNNVILLVGSAAMTIGILLLLASKVNKKFQAIKD